MIKLFLVLIVGLAAQIAAEPVFLWGSKSPSFIPPSLSALSGDEFVTLVNSQVDEDSLTVLFVEKRLSIEDFSQCTKTCFKNLQNIPEKTFLNSVENPVDALIASHNKKKSITLSSEDDLEDVDVEKENFLIVNFDDVKNSEDFDKHDELMNQIVNKLQSKYPKLMAIYTGLNPSFKYSEPLKRKVREAAEEKVESKSAEKTELKTEEKPAAAKQQIKPRAEGDEENIDDVPPYILLSDTKAMIAILQWWVKGENVIASAAPTYTVNIPAENPMSMIVTLVSGSHQLVMNVTNTTGRWEVDTFKYANEVYYPKEAAVWGFTAEWSFGCKNLTLEAPAPVVGSGLGDRKVISLVKFQFQPSWEGLKPKEGMDNIEFGPCNDCIGFFSAGIWGGLFVVILLLLILFWGLGNMMEIRTMDRFDDPKGKTITVSAVD